MAPAVIDGFNYKQPTPQTFAFINIPTYYEKAGYCLQGNL